MPKKQLTISDLTLENIYSRGTFSQRGIGQVRWMKDNVSYSTIESAKSGGREIVRYEAATGTRTVLVAASRLVPTGEKKPLGIEDYQWSADNSKMLIFTNTRKVWRYNTRGDYWVLNLKTGAMK